MWCKNTESEVYVNALVATCNLQVIKSGEIDWTTHLEQLPALLR